MHSPYTVVRLQSRRQSQKYRDLKKKQIQEKINAYDLFNGICKLFGPQEWSPKAFKHVDIPMVGDRKERNRIASRNSRERAKAMENELEARVKVLEQALAPQFMPLDFPFPFVEENKIFGEHSHGVWVCEGSKWRKY